MSRITKEINKVTGTVISMSLRLIILALFLMVTIEGARRGYAFGHEIFYASAMESAPGTDKTITIPPKQSAAENAKLLKEKGLIESDLILQIQMKFYEYKIYPGTYELNTSMTSKEILQILNEKPKDEEKKPEPPKETKAEGKADADKAAAAETQPTASGQAAKETVPDHASGGTEVRIDAGETVPDRIQNEPVGEFENGDTYGVEIRIEGGQ